MSDLDTHTLNCMKSLDTTVRLEDGLVHLNDKKGVFSAERCPTNVGSSCLFLWAASGSPDSGWHFRPGLRVAANAKPS
jgi:hypothetical protein